MDIAAPFGHASLADAVFYVVPFHVFPKLVTSMLWLTSELASVKQFEETDSILLTFFALCSHFYSKAVATCATDRCHELH